MFKFIHTADIHLDSPLKSLALRNPQIADLVGGATRRTFEKIIDLCIEEQVNALIIAGDLYDGDQRSMKTAAFFTSQMHRLHEAGVRVYMIQGNHDSKSEITKYLKSLPNVHLFTGHGGIEELRDFGVAIHGVSYSKTHAPESLLHKYKPPIPGLINIGILHTSLSGATGHDNYAPCSIHELIAHGFDYWALGHIHRRHVHSEFPWVVMPGMPQGRDIGEEGLKSVTIVTVTDQNIQVSERCIADSEFRRVQIDITDISEWFDAMTKIQKTLKEVQKNTQATHMICKIHLIGKSPLYWHLHRNTDRLAAEATEIALQIGNIFIDDITNEVIEPLVHGTNNVDPVDELNALMILALKDEVFCTQAISFLEKSIKKLPPELRHEYSEDPNQLKVLIQDLTSAGILEITASLKDTETELEGT